MSLHDVQVNFGAIFAPDGIPLHYGDQLAEYRAAIESVVLMDRSHEGRLQATGRDRIDLIQRISTNDLANMKIGDGRPTIFTNTNGRILDRIEIYDRGETALIIAEPGRGEPLRQFLQRQVFFNDEVAFSNLAPVTQQFALHGPEADAVINNFLSGTLIPQPFQGIETQIAGVPVFLARRKSAKRKSLDDRSAACRCRTGLVVSCRKSGGYERCASRITDI